MQLRNQLGILYFLYAANQLFGGEPRLAWTDSNPASTMVDRYKVYELMPDGAPVNLHLEHAVTPKTTDDLIEVSVPLFLDMAGKTYTVTAINAAGLESEPATPSITIPLVYTTRPTDVRLAFDFVNRTIEILWVNASLPEEATQGHIVFQKKSETEWIEVARTTDPVITRVAIPTPGTRETYTVAAYNIWGESAKAVSASIPTVTLPVTALRIINATP